jgi:hypothetical protein
MGIFNSAFSLNEDQGEIGSFYAYILFHLSFEYLLFLFSEWDIVSWEISNGSSDIQSKIVYYKSREQYTN